MESGRLPLYSGRLSMPNDSSWDRLVSMLPVSKNRFLDAISPGLDETLLAGWVGTSVSGSLIGGSTVAGVSERDVIGDPDA